MLLKVLVGKGDQGFYAAWSGAKDAKHRREAQMLGIYPDIWSPGNGPLPYRLTRAQIKVLDDRMGLLLWPHYVERLYYEGHSFWTHPSRMWKMRRKLRLLYYILPTQIRDQVPPVRHALYTFVWAMRRLEGCWLWNTVQYYCVSINISSPQTHTCRSSTLVENVQKSANIAGCILCEQRWGAGLSHGDNSRSCPVRGNSTFKSFKPRDAPFCALCAIHPDPRVTSCILDDGFRKVQQIFEEFSAKQPASRGWSNVCIVQLMNPWI